MLFFLFRKSYIFWLFLFSKKFIINQKNTWEIKLIDHLSEIIRVDTEEDTETNFQKVLSTQ